MITVEKIRVNHKALKKDFRYRVVKNGALHFSWSVRSDRIGDRQSACRLKLWSEDGFFVDTGWLQQESQSYLYEGELPTEQRIWVSVTVRHDGEASDAKEDYFFVSNLEELSPQWIAAPQDRAGSVLYFKKNVEISKPLKKAALYVCGIGYHRLMINGACADNSLLEPPLTDFTKQACYVMYPEIENSLMLGSNMLAVQVAEGWRRNIWSRLLSNHDIPRFYGRPQLSLVLRLFYEDGTVETVHADEDWTVGYGGIVRSHLFHGETFDANWAIPKWASSAEALEGFMPAIRVDAPCENTTTAVMEPIRPAEIYKPKSMIRHPDGVYLIDFGQNIAGVTSLSLPKNLLKGTKITVKTGEFLGPDGKISWATMRDVESTDTYIASGDDRDLEVWQPVFTYHGFRYAEVTGIAILKKEDIQAISFYNDIALESNFTCGSAIANAIHKMAVQTEKANIHHILTDCPQRDERMGWMNDATVRFEETPYNFDVGTIFPKIVRDLVDTQGEDGSITCTAPFMYGSRPADPVSSSFLIAAWQAYRYTGNKAILEENFDRFALWESCLGNHAEGDIVQYSYYGDWAAPVYACEGGEHNVDATKNAHTPGIFMSTGYYYLNAVLLSKMAEVLGDAEKNKQYREMAERIKTAMLNKWWDGKKGIMATGSQGCQSFALWLGIVPEEKRALAAKVMNDDLVARNFRFTTGNLCTRYLLDMLTEYGYVDSAWELMTRENYPSYGYMLQNGATTVWERFECKTSVIMNSHCHPMYGSVDAWFYSHIAGIKFDGEGCEKVTVKPYFPKSLLSASAEVETVMGVLSVRWMKLWGELSLIVDVPFGMKATVELNGQKTEVGSGLTILKQPLEI